MNRLTKITLIASIIFFLLVLLLTLSSYITFGYGLGDFFYVIIVSIWVLLITIVYFKTKKKDFNKDKFLALLIISVLVLSIFYTVFKFTVGRGSEYMWNGHVFFQ